MTLKQSEETRYKHGLPFVPPEARCRLCGFGKASDLYGGCIICVREKAKHPVDGDAGCLYFTKGKKRITPSQGRVRRAFEWFEKGLTNRQVALKVGWRAESCAGDARKKWMAAKLAAPEGATE